MRTLIFFLMLLAGLESAAQNANACILRGNQYYRQSQFAEAEGQYRKALEYEPKNAVASYNLANALQQQKKFTEATELLGTLASTTDKKSIRQGAYYNQGVAFSKQKELDASIESYKNALRLDPNDQQARENLQKALREKKQSQSQSQKKPDPKMSQKEAEQKLQLLNQKEKQIQQRVKQGQNGGGTKQAQDW